MSTNQEMLDAALAVANKARGVLGFGPVDHLYKGMRVASSRCPITNTVYDDDIDRHRIGVSTTQHRINIWERRRVDGAGIYDDIAEVRMPVAATDFVFAFDNGKFSDLEIEE